jgi:hypothetical protein
MESRWSWHTSTSTTNSYAVSCYLVCAYYIKQILPASRDLVKPFFSLSLPLCVNMSSEFTSIFVSSQADIVNWIEFPYTWGDDARPTREIKSRISGQKQHSIKRRHFTSKLGFNLSKKLLKCYICSVDLCGAENWALRKIDQKYIGSFEMRCWRRVTNINWTCCVKNEDVHTA